MTQGRGSSQIGQAGPIGHPHAIFTVTVSDVPPTNQRSGDSWIKVPPPAVRAAQRAAKENPDGDVHDA